AGSLLERENPIGHIGLVTQLRAHVIVEGGGVRGQDGRAGGIIKAAVGGLRIGAGETAVEAAYAQFVIEQQIVGEGEDVNAQVVSVNYLFAQSGVAGKVVDDFLTCLRREGVSLV